MSIDNMDYRERRNLLNEFYKSKAWRNVREVALKRDNYICQKCGIKPAEVVHHKIHLTPQNVNDASISLNLDNLISLCAEDHFEEHRGEHCKGRMKEEENPYTFDANGMLIPKKRESGTEGLGT